MTRTAASSFINDELYFDEITKNGDGLVEVSSLTDVDTGLANKLAAVINRLHVSDVEHARNKRLAAFVARPISEKIAMGEFESPRKFLRALSKQGKSKISLPAFYITRAPNIAWAPIDRYTNRQGTGELLDPDGEYLGEINQSVASLTYQINIVGWQNDEIESLALFIMTWIRQPNVDHSFQVKTALGGAPYTLNANIADRHDVTAESESMPFEEDRLRVLSLMLMVDAEVVNISYGDRTVSKIGVASYISPGKRGGS
jgi:hypothetical protein